MSLPIHVALVSQSAKVTINELSPIAAALSKQVLRDFSPVWNVRATVDVFADGKVPPGYWPIYIKDDIGTPGAAGVHMDNHGQPYSLVQASDDPDLSITISHELLEMLADPFGNRMVAGNSVDPKNKQRVRYLLEVADPCEMFAYTINGIKVSDFYLPRYFDPVANHSSYSFTGALKKPLQVAQGGYLSYIDSKGKWWQATYFGAKLQFDGPYNWSYQTDPAQSMRSMIDRLTSERQNSENIHKYTIVDRLSEF